MDNVRPSSRSSRAGHTAGSSAPQRAWSADQVREAINLDHATLRDLARDWNAMSPSGRRQFYGSIASEARRCRIPGAKNFTEAVVRLVEDQAARDAHTYRLTVGPVSASGPDPLDVLLLAIGGVVLLLSARHVDRVLAASVGGGEQWRSIWHSSARPSARGSNAPSSSRLWRR